LKIKETEMNLNTSLQVLLNDIAQKQKKGLPFIMAGIRVNEGTALHWNDIDLTKKRIRVHHMRFRSN